MSTLPNANNSNKDENKVKAPLFKKVNYILMIAGVFLLFLGYTLLAGGKAQSDTVFSEALFDTRRLVVAPTLMLIGLVVEIFAIMYHPLKRKAKNN